MSSETRLAFLLRKSGISDTEFCEKTGTTKANLSKFKAGSSTPTLKNALKIAKFLGVSVEDIWGFEEEN